MRIIKDINDWMGHLYLLKRHINTMQIASGEKHGSCHVLTGIDITIERMKEILKQFEDGNTPLSDKDIQEKWGQA